MSATQMLGITAIPLRTAHAEVAWTRASARLRAQLAMLLIACTLTAANSCSRDPVTRVRLRLDDAPGGQKVALAPASSLMRCPPAGAPILQPSASTGHHRVILSWNASAPSSRPENDAIGYCLYRSTTKNAAKQNPVCGSCEQVNATPVAATGCVDELVKDGVAYYYVVTAISTKGMVSASSNEIPVAIPPSNQKGSWGPVGNYASCRAPGTSQ